MFTKEFKMFEKRVSYTVLALALPVSSYAIEHVSVGVYGAHSGKEVTYFYEVTNNEERRISHFAIGKIELVGEWERKKIPQLSVFPVDSEWTSDDRSLTTGKNTSPNSWKPEFQFVGGTLKYMYSWLASDWDSSIRQGDRSNFSLSLKSGDKGAYEGSFTASYADGEKPKIYSSALVKLDVTSPTADISVNTDEIWPPNKKMQNILVDINAFDDYDPEPLAILESITANEPLADGDVLGAEYGTNDTQFQLKATRDGKNKDGRIYTITYTVHDGTGNKTKVQTDVVVPHDRR